MVGEVGCAVTPTSSTTGPPGLHGRPAILRVSVFSMKVIDTGTEEESVSTPVMVIVIFRSVTKVGKVKQGQITCQVNCAYVDHDHATVISDWSRIQ